MSAGTAHFRIARLHKRHTMSFDIWLRGLAEGSIVTRFAEANPLTRPCRSP